MRVNVECRNPNDERNPNAEAPNDPLRARFGIWAFVIHSTLGLRHSSFLRLCVLCASVVFSSGVAHACNVPVFRYALERWRPDRYEVVLFHRGPLAAEEQAALEPLYNAEDQERLTLTKVDLDKPLAPDFQQLWDAQEKAELPWLVVLYPTQLRIGQPVWAGQVNAETASLLTNSPARQELAKRLISGQTAVWLLLESGDAAADDQATALLEEQLKELQKTLELPELTATPEDEVRSAIPLAVAFSVLRVSRSDPKERLLAQMLLGSEEDLRERSDAMVFPVFGRGRALFPLVGAGITAQNIADAAGFLVGPCSCQLKEFNPGVDLLNTADWDRIWGDDAEAALVAQAEDAAAAEPGTQVPIPTGPPALAPPPAAVYDAPVIVEHYGWFSMLFNRRILVAGGIVVAVVLAIVCLIASQRSHARTRPEP
jgi:hypothetical protein